MEWYRLACQLDLEGIVAKADSPYEDTPDHLLEPATSSEANRSMAALNSD